MIDWNKAIEAVHRHNGRVVPMKFSRMVDADTFNTMDCPDTNTSNMQWHADGSDWCSHDVWYIRNVIDPTATETPTLRDQLAMAALTGFLSFGAARLHPCERMAKDAYQVADAMMEARNA